MHPDRCPSVAPVLFEHTAGGFSDFPYIAIREFNKHIYFHNNMAKTQEWTTFIQMGGYLGQNNKNQEVPFIQFQLLYTYLHSNSVPSIYIKISERSRFSLL